MPDPAKAAELIRSGAIERVDGAVTYKVRSQSQPDRLYVVTIFPPDAGLANRCDCPAHTASRRRLCKHLMACVWQEQLDSAPRAPTGTAEAVAAAMSLGSPDKGWRPSSHPDDYYERERPLHWAPFRGPSAAFRRPFR